MNIFLMILVVLVSFIQYYICWMTYINWFKHEIFYCKIHDSESIGAMRYLLPIFVWIPIVPILVIVSVCGWKYLTIEWIKLK